MEEKIEKVIDELLNYLCKLPTNDKIIVVEGIAGAGKTTYIYEKFGPVNTCLLPEIRIRPDKFSMERQKEYLTLNLRYTEFAQSILNTSLIKKVVLDRGLISTLAYAYSQDTEVFLKLIQEVFKQKRTFTPKYLYLKKPIDESLKRKRLRDGTDKHPVWSYKHPVLKIEEFYDYVFKKGSRLNFEIISCN